MSWMSEYLLQQSLQISVLFAAVLLATWILRNASAHWRYLLWLLVVAKCLVPACFCLQLAVWPADVADTDSVIDRNSVAADAIPAQQSIEQPAIASSETQNRAKQIPAESDKITSALPSPQRSTSTPPEHQGNLQSESAVSPIVAGGPGDLPRWLALLWLLPVCILTGFVGGKAWTTHQRLVRRRALADRATTERVAELAKRLGLNKCPRVFVGETIAQPFVWGFLRGDIYLPVRFVKTCSEEQQTAVLTHELAHVARYDAAFNLLQIAAQILFFFHPLVWWANKRIREEREKCCDEIVIAGIGTKPQQYCEAIVEMLTREVQSRQATPGLTMAGSTRKIEDRINTLLTPDRKFRRRPARLGLVCLGMLGIATLSTSFALTHRSMAQETTNDQKSNDQESKQELAQETPEATAGSNWEPGKLVEVKVVNEETGKPLAGVKLHTQNAGPGIDFGESDVFETDKDGMAKVPMTELPANAVRIYPVKAGFVPLRIYWESKPCAVIPDSLTIPMQTAKRVGGTIVDESGEPIPEVALQVQYWGPGKGKAAGDDPHIRPNIVASTTTDMSGNWKLDTFPDGLVDETQLYIHVYHPDFVSDHHRRGFLENPVLPRPLIANLYDQTAIMTMRKGESFTGRVVDEDDRPIVDASIHLRENYWNETNGARAKTDEDGQFRISGIETSPPGEPRRIPGFDESLLTLTIEAAGYAPELVKVNDLSKPALTRLSPGNTTTIRIVDDTGKPLEGAYIQARKWRDQNHRIHVVAKSDQEGRIELTDLPLDEVLCDFGKQGFMNIDHYSLKPQDEEILITLRDPVKVIGSVVDKVTGKPLDMFTMTQGIDYEDGRNTHWLNYREGKFTNGRYETEFNQVFAYRVRVEAEGYMPAESRIFKPHDPDAGVLTWDFELEKADPVVGIVHGLDGKPLANATVYQATQLIQISQGKISYVDHTELSVKTDEEGRFELPPENQPYCLVVEHEDGVAMLKDVDHVESTPVTIKEWASITEGLFNINRRPSKDGQKANFPPPDDGEE